MKYLVTGGSGKLGKELTPLIECVAPSHSELDILSPTTLRALIAQPDVDGIVHLAAISSRAKAENDKRLSYQVNVLGTRNLANLAKEYNKKIYYISTEIVFPGVDGGYKEADQPSPRDWYGFTKYAGELEIQESGAEHLIIRTTFRPSNWGFPTAYTNVTTTGDYTDVIAKEIALCLTLSPSGTIHIGTPIKTWYELALRRNPDVLPEEFPDQTFLKRDLNITRWNLLKQSST